MASHEDETDILEYLRTSPQNFFSAREICRRAGGKRKWEENNRWALPVLSQLVDKELVETNPNGHFRLCLRR